MKAELNYPPLSMQWKRLRRNISDYGMGATLSKVINSVGRLFYYNRAYTIYRSDLRKLPLQSQADDSFSFRFLGAEEAKPYRTQVLAMEEWLIGAFDSILAEGGRCLVALDGDTLAGFNLVSFNQIVLPVINFTRKLRDGEAYSEQITVAKQYRGRNLGTKLRLELFKALRDQGIQKIYGGTDINNHANLALCGKVGLKPIANIRRIEFFGLKTMKIQRRRS